MTMTPLSIQGAWVYTPRQFDDPRGTFLEAYQGATLTQATGRPFELAQVNTSISKAGVVRGIHYSDVPPSQAKYVTCPRGALWDVVVDIRVGSPTYGHWEGILLDDVERRAVYLSEGLGHGFIALEHDTTALYLCSTPYAPGREHGINPLDPALGIQWPSTSPDGTPLEPLLSDKDRDAPSLEQARAGGLLPTIEQVRDFLG